MRFKINAETFDAIGYDDEDTGYFIVLEHQRDVSYIVTNYTDKHFTFIMGPCAYISHIVGHGVDAITVEIIRELTP